MTAKEREKIDDSHLSETFDFSGNQFIREIIFSVNFSLLKVSIKADFEKLNDELTQKFQTMADL